MLFSVFFYFDPLHRDLHSFPTRRSSDLPHFTFRIPNSEQRRLIFIGSGDSEAESASRLVRDRKSTRLNSSHRCISYAVFCLKKKKATQRICRPQPLWKQNII